MLLVCGPGVSMKILKSRASAARKSFLYRYFSATRSGKPLLVPDKPSSGEPEPEASVFAKLMYMLAKFNLFLRSGTYT